MHFYLTTTKRLSKKIWISNVISWFRNKQLTIFFCKDLFLVNLTWLRLGRRRPWFPGRFSRCPWPLGHTPTCGVSAHTPGLVTIWVLLWMFHCKQARVNIVKCVAVFLCPCLSGFELRRCVSSKKPLSLRPVERCWKERTRAKASQMRNHWISLRAK